MYRSSSKSFYEDAKKGNLGVLLVRILTRIVVARITPRYIVTNIPVTAVSDSGCHNLVIHESTLYSIIFQFMYITNINISVSDLKEI